ncbi:MAG: sulfotransferase [Devosia sp.]
MSDTNRWEGPLFVVGASRSGTAMMRSIFNRHPLIQLAGETHYFDDLRVRSSISSRGPVPKHQEAMCADYFRALDDRPYGMRGNPARSPLSQDALIGRAKSLGGGLDAYFESHCRDVAARAGKRVWGEKTPRHIFRLNDILTAFPSARVICMVRDPRAVVASYRDWRNQGGLNPENDDDYKGAIKAEERRAKLSYNIVIATLLWRGTVNAAVKARNAFGRERVHIARYEDITHNPSETVAQLCEWLDIPFETAMLDVPMHNSSVVPYDAHAGISKVAVKRWRQVLSPREVDVIQSIAGRCLQDAGFEPENIPRYRIYKACEYAKLPMAFGRATLANRDRMGNVVSYSWRRLRAITAR